VVGGGRKVGGAWGQAKTASEITRFQQFPNLSLEALGGKELCDDGYELLTEEFESIRQVRSGQRSVVPQHVMPGALVTRWHHYTQAQRFSIAGDMTANYIVCQRGELPPPGIVHLTVPATASNCNAGALVLA